MPWPTAPPRSAWLVGLVSCALSAALTSFTVPQVAALTIVVDPSGAGDVTTIQAAFDRLPDPSGTDSIIVRAGSYEETVVVREREFVALFVIAPAGPSQTRVRDLHFDYPRTGIPQVNFTEFVVRGFTLVEHLETPLNSANRLRFVDCVFESGARSSTALCNGTGNFQNCTFRGRVELYGHTGAGEFRDLRFERATLHVTTGSCGALGFRRCTFEGPRDTLVIAFSAGDAFIRFSECRFENADHAIVVDPRTSPDEGIVVEESHFDDIGQPAIFYEGRPVATSPLTSSGLRIVDSRFERCGGAVRWLTMAKHPLDLTRVTIVGTNGPAIEARARSARLDHVVVEGAGGDAVTIHRDPDRIGPSLGQFTVRDSRIVGAAGSGLVVRDTSQLATRPIAQVTNNVFAKNDGHGLDIGSHAFLVHGNVVYRNGGDGIRFVTSIFGRADTLHHNTSALNGGDGIRYAVGGSSAAVIENNLVAGNSGVGLRVSDSGAEPEAALTRVRGYASAAAHVTPLATTARHNDSWANAGGAYAGVGPSFENLELDPLFCDPAADDYRVHEDSPCAPSGIFGQIGALGVGCAAIRIEVSNVTSGGGRAMPARSNRPIEVAILESTWFDAALVDDATLRLGGAAPITTRGHRATLRDVNGDDRADLVVSFRWRDIARGSDGVANLTGVTLDGIPFQSTVAFDRGSVSQPEEVEPRISVDALPAQLAIARVSPNPIRTSGLVDLALPRAGETTLEIIDVTGRRVASRSCGMLSAGRHRVELSTGALRPGIYLLRLVQAGEGATARIVVTE